MAAAAKTGWSEGLSTKSKEKREFLLPLRDGGQPGLQAGADFELGKAGQGFPGPAQDGQEVGAIGAAGEMAFDQLLFRLAQSAFQEGREEFLDPFTGHWSPPCCLSLRILAS